MQGFIYDGDGVVGSVTEGVCVGFTLMSTRKAGSRIWRGKERSEGVARDDGVGRRGK